MTRTARVIIASTRAATGVYEDRTGALSPFGDLTFPMPSEDLPYTHPVTVVNK